MPPKKSSIPMWWEAYANQDERNFFIGEDGSSGLVRGVNKDGKHLTWRTITALVRESGLSQDKVEKIISKYYALGTVVKDEKKKDENTVHWGYFENVNLVEDEQVSMGEADKQQKLGTAMRAVAAGQGMGAAAANTPAAVPGGVYGNSSPQTAPHP